MSDSFPYHRRNSFAFILQGVLFFIGYCFFDVNTVVPVFIEALTGRVELAGIANTIKAISTVALQITVGSYIVKVKHVPRYIGTIMLFGYIAPLLLVMPLLLGMDAMRLAVLALSAVSLMWISDGLIVIGYFDLLGRTVSSESRGRALGLSQLIGSVGAMGGAYAVKRLLDSSIDFNNKYAIIFGIGGSVLLLAALSMFIARDVPRKVHQDKYSLLDQLKKIPYCVRSNAEFRKVLVTNALFSFAMMSAPYVLVMAMDKFSLEPGTVSTLLNVQVFGALLGGAVGAFLSPKFGNKLSVLLFCFMSALCAGCGLLAIFGAGNIVFLLAVTVLASGFGTSSWIGFMNVIIDVSELDNTPSYILANSLVMFPLSASALIGGQIIKHFGYTEMLVVSLVMGVGAVAVAISLFKHKIHDRFIDPDGV